MDEQCWGKRTAHFFAFIFLWGLRVMETIKSTIQLVFLPGFRVAPICTYFNMLTLARLETRQKSGALLVDFKISMTLTEILQLFYRLICLPITCYTSSVEYIDSKLALTV